MGASKTLFTLSPGPAVTLSMKECPSGHCWSPAGLGRRRSHSGEIRDLTGELWLAGDDASPKAIKVSFSVTAAAY